MKKMLFLALTVLAMMASCGEKNKNVPFEELNVGVTERDTMIYGFCASGSAMNTLQIITDGGDTLTLSVVEARNKNQVFGGYALGDEIAVTVNSDTTEAIMVVNKSTLNGDWVMPNPIDGSSYQGISIMKGGTAESIDQSNITYKSWMLFNGRLLIVASRDDGPGKDETLQFKILRLTTDSLFLSDGDDIYEYARPVVEPEIDLGIELDDGMDDFFL